MAGQRYRETAPGQSPLASSGRWSGSCALERLEPEASSAGVHPSAASPTCAGADGIWHFCQSTSLACAPVPHAAGAVSSRLAGALRSQRAYKSESGDDQTVRHLGSVCHLARTGNGLTPFCQPLGIPLLGQACFSEWSLMAFFSGCSSISYGLRNELWSIRSSIVSILCFNWKEKAHGGGVMGWILEAERKTGIHTPGERWKEEIHSISSQGIKLCLERSKKVKCSGKSV